MAHVTLRKIQISGFGVFAKTVVVDLDLPGLILVTGENKDSAAASSNGSGKTTVFKAVSWALFGKTIDGLTTNVVSLDENAAEVVLYFDMGKTQFCLERCRRATTGSLMFYKRTTPDNGAWDSLSQRKTADTQKAIEQLIGMDFDSFRCCILFGQGDISRFANPSLTDAARKDVLRRLFQLDVYDHAKESAKREETNAGVGLDEAFEKYGLIENDLRDQKAEFDKMEVEMKGLVEMQTSGKAQLEQAEQEIDSSTEDVVELSHRRKEINAKYKEVVTEYDEVDHYTKAASRLNINAIAEHQRAGKFVELVESGKDCPTCGEKLTSWDVPKAHNLLDKAKEELDEIDADINELVDESHELFEELDKLRREERRIDRAIDRAEGLIATRQRDQKRLRASLNTVNDDVDRLNEDLALFADDLSDTKETLAEAGSVMLLKKKELDAWKWVSRVVYGSKGVPAYAIEQLLPALNAQTNDHLARLSDGDLSVCWTATTKGASGQDKEQLTCNMTIDGLAGVVPSGGQLRKIELATELALAEIVADSGASSFNVLFFDEALDGIDSVAQQHVISWLKTLSVASIFVVSHTVGVADHFEKRLHIVKEEGVATVDCVSLC